MAVVECAVDRDLLGKNGLEVDDWVKLPIVPRGGTVVPALTKAMCYC